MKFPIFLPFLLIFLVLQCSAIYLFDFDAMRFPCVWNRAGVVHDDIVVCCAFAKPNAITEKSDLHCAYKWLKPDSSLSDTYNKIWGLQLANGVNTFSIPRKNTEIDLWQPRIPTKESTRALYTESTWHFEVLEFWFDAFKSDEARNRFNFASFWQTYFTI